MGRSLSCQSLCRSRELSSLAADRASLRVLHVLTSWCVSRSTTTHSNLGPESESRRLPEGRCSTRKRAIIYPERRRPVAASPAQAATRQASICSSLARGVPSTHPRSRRPWRSAWCRRKSNINQRNQTRPTSKTRSSPDQLFGPQRAHLSGRNVEVPGSVRAMCYVTPQRRRGHAGR